jgi:hypothetical protein
MSKVNNKIENRTPGFRRILRLWPIFLLVVLAIVGIKGWRIYQKGMTVYEDVTALRSMARTPVENMDFTLIASTMIDLQGDLDDFTLEAKPALWLAPRLGWVPTYGGDLANGPKLIELANHLVDASVKSLQAAEPLLNEVNASDSPLDPAALTSLLVDAQPQLLDARDEFDRVVAARNDIEDERLSPRVGSMLTEELDPLLAVMDDGLSLAMVLPTVLGTDGNIPKNYLLLVQNEDELRTTGGFITTVGKLTVQNGQIITLDFEGVDNEEDWSKPFPSAPWQLQEYMNARVLILRDSNWFTDFPTSALWAEYLYAYNHPGELDGVIAFDQQFLVMLLRVLGPLEVNGAPYPLTSDNVVEYMRSAKEPPADEPTPAGWYRKSFITDVADAILHELIGGVSNDWRGLAFMLMRAMDERHLLVQFDDPVTSALLAKHGWDGAVDPGDGDFLMTTDSNIGFNKTNALVDISISYDVDLTDISSPKGSLILTHRNNASRDVQCIQFDVRPQPPDDYYYSMDRCYWTYTRVYKQSGVKLLYASPHKIPAEWMLQGRHVPPRVDELDEEIDGVRGFGTLLVVPGDQSLNTSFEFALPATVVTADGGNPNRHVYRLRVQKQPGTLANPLTIRLHLPNRSRVESVSMDALVQGDDLLIETDLRTDVYLEAVFHVP